MKKNKSSNYSWRTLDSNEVFTSPYFHLKVESCELPDGRVMPRYYVMDFPDWVQVVARDEDRNYIMVRQYRYPANSTFIEFPGGTTHSDRKEAPLVAAQRELLEETGYSSEHWEYLGYHCPNPALLNNKCHVFAADRCTRTDQQNLDPFEIIDVEILTLDQLENEIGSSQQNSLAIATYHLARKKRP